MFWLCQADLEGATSKATVIACFDDANLGAGSLDDQAICSIIDRAEQETLSWLAGEYGPPPIPATTLAMLAQDSFLKNAALEFAVIFMLEKHPEYVRSDGKVLGERMKRAVARMERIVQARQQPPTVAQRPANVGGVAVDNGNRIYVDNADGTRNSGDY